MIWTWPVSWERITEVIFRCVVPSTRVTAGLTPILGYICRMLVLGWMYTVSEPVEMTIADKD